MKKIFLIFLLFFLNLPVLRAEEISQIKDLSQDPAHSRLQAVLEKGLKAYASIRDYKAIFQKQEKSKGVLGPKETIFLKFEKPFKIFMGWTNTEKKGLQVLYERGKRDGKLAIHKPGLLLGLVPVLLLDPSSPWVREGSESYDIEDAGIGSFLTDFSEAVSKAAGEKKLSVNASMDKSGQIMDVVFENSKENSGYFAYHVVVHFDQASSLPDRMTLYDWEDKITGLYAYENLKLNIGTEDAEFKQLAQRQLYKFFYR